MGSHFRYFKEGWWDRIYNLEELWFCAKGRRQAKSEAGGQAVGSLVRAVTLSIPTHALGSLPDSSLSPWPLDLSWLSYSGLIGFLHIRCGLPAPVSRKTGIVTKLWPQCLATRSPEEEEEEEEEGGGDWNVNCSKASHVHLSMATEVVTCSVSI